MCTKALIEILGVGLSLEVTIFVISACFSWALDRAVIKSTFVKSKTSPSPGISSPRQVQVQMRLSKQRKINNLLQNHILNY